LATGSRGAICKYQSHQSKQNIPSFHAEHRYSSNQKSR